MKDEDLLAAMEREGLLADHLPNTRQTYQRIIADYLAKLARREVKDFQGYLDFMAADKKVCSSSVRLVLNAGVFFCKKVLKREPPAFKLPPARRGKRVPVFMTHRECLAVLGRLERVPRLQCAMMYGCGFRPSEVMMMRLKDVDFGNGMLTVRGGKGDKDRTVRMPRSLEDELREQVARCKRFWERDHAAGRICPSPVPSLMRKLGRRLFATPAWYWLFPSRLAYPGERWHGTTHGVSAALKDAVEGAGIDKWVTLRTWRHSYATNLLHVGTDIRTLQVQLGHSKVETTEIYTHAIGARGTESPLDRRDVAGAADIIYFPGCMSA